eukprot:240401-Chlamydomonas_euryale.AAC.7
MHQQRLCSSGSGRQSKIGKARRLRSSALSGCRGCVLCPQAYEADNAAVLRDGIRVLIPTADLVPGDIVELSVGSKVW